MKLSRPAAVIGAAVVLVGGVTVAVHAATASTDSTKLCVQKNASVASVYAPGDGVVTCQKGFKLVELASADALAALQTQVDALQGQVTDAQAQAAKTQTRSWHGTAQIPYTMTLTVGGWTIATFCRPTGTVEDRFLDGAYVTRNNDDHYEIVSVPDTSGSITPVQIGGPVAFLTDPNDTQTVQLASFDGPDEALTLTVSRKRTGNDCSMAITVSAS